MTANSDPNSLINDPRCSFCGRYKRQVRYVVGGEKVRICDECVRKADDMMRSASVEERIAATTKDLQSEVASLREQLEQCRESMESTTGTISGMSYENSRLRTLVSKLQAVVTILRESGPGEKLNIALKDLDDWTAMKEQRAKEGLDTPLQTQYSAPHFSGGSPSMAPSGKPEPERGADSGEVQQAAP